jgi:hypothetical protein
MRARQSGIGDSVGPAFHLSLFTFHQVLENGVVTIFSNGVRVSGVLVNGVVFVSHEFYQSFLFERANGSSGRWASNFGFGFWIGIGGWGGARGVGFGVTESSGIGAGGESLTRG